MNTATLFSSATDLWATPQWLFDVLHKEFNFVLDVCAKPDNAKCSAYFTETSNGLIHPWHGNCWMNPPYGRTISQWVRKAYSEAHLYERATVACLLPARTDTKWWWDYCIKGHIRFLPGRLKFGTAKNSAPFPSAIVIFDRANKVPSVRWWDVKHAR